MIPSKEIKYKLLLKDESKKLDKKKEEETLHFVRETTLTIPIREISYPITRQEQAPLFN
jgi:hypothetical protein